VRHPDAKVAASGILNLGGFCLLCHSPRHPRPRKTTRDRSPESSSSTRVFLCWLFKQLRTVSWPSNCISAATGAAGVLAQRGGCFQESHRGRNTCLDSVIFGSLKYLNHWSLDERVCELPIPCYLAVIGSSALMAFSGTPN
jgi:hypothetical protein